METISDISGVISPYLSAFSEYLNVISELWTMTWALSALVRRARGRAYLTLRALRVDWPMKMMMGKMSARCSRRTQSSPNGSTQWIPCRIRRRTYGIWVKKRRWKLKSNPNDKNSVRYSYSTITALYCGKTEVMQKLVEQYRGSSLSLSKPTEKVRKLHFSKGYNKIKSLQPCSSALSSILNVSMLKCWCSSSRPNVHHVLHSS